MKPKEWKMPRIKHPNSRRKKKYLVVDDEFFITQEPTNEMLPDQTMLRIRIIHKGYPIHCKVMKTTLDGKVEAMIIENGHFEGIQLFFTRLLNTKDHAHFVDLIEL